MGVTSAVRDVLQPPEALETMQRAKFQRLMDRVRRRESQAMEEFLREYGEAVQREVRFTLLDARLRRVVSESDVCQSVMARFLVGVWAGKFNFESASDAVGLLKVMVRARVADLNRYWTAHRRDLHRNVGLQQPHTPTELKTPSRIVAADELLDEVWQRLNERERRIIELRQTGASWAQIAERLDVESPEALRKQYERRLILITEELGLKDLP